MKPTESLRDAELSTANEPLRHDYSRENCQGGWNIVGFEFLDAGTVKVSGFGLKNTPHGTLKEAYLLPGEELVISMPDGHVLYEITSIHYHHDPCDLYEAELKY